MIRREAAALLTGLLILAAGIISEVVSHAQERASAWVAHTREVISRLESARAFLVSAESAERAFLLTSEERLLVDFSQARAAAQQDVQAVARLTADNPLQQRQVQRLLELIGSRFDVLVQAIALQRAGQRQAAAELVREKGLGQSSELASQVALMRQEEERLLAERLEDASAAARFGTLSNVTATALALGVLAYLYRLWARHARETTRRTMELNEANTRLHELATTLERRVAERTEALSQVNAELEQFARTVAHDLRAPARNIEAYAAVLADNVRSPGADVSLYAERLLGTARRMQELITGLLEYSRLAHADVRLERVDLRQVVEQVLNDLRAQIEQSGGQVAAQATFPAVMGHYATLGSAVTNLVSNALKFVKPGQVPRVHITAQRGGDEVVLCVHDEGIGVPAAEHERIFLPFTRLHGQETYSGTGIGLAVVRRSVERMGGRVKLHSVEGAGSRFELHLKAA